MGSTIGTSLSLFLSLLRLVPAFLVVSSGHDRLDVSNLALVSRFGLPFAHSSAPPPYAFTAFRWFSLLDLDNSKSFLWSMAQGHPGSWFVSLPYSSLTSPQISFIHLIPLLSPSLTLHPTIDSNSKLFNAAGHSSLDAFTRTHPLSVRSSWRFVHIILLLRLNISVSHVRQNLFQICRTYILSLPWGPIDLAHARRARATIPIFISYFRFDITSFIRPFSTST